MIKCHMTCDIGRQQSETVFSVCAQHQLSAIVFPNCQYVMPHLSGGWSILVKDFNKSERIKYFVCLKSLLIHSGLVYVTSDLWSSAVALAGLWWIGWLLWDSCRRFRSLLGCYRCQRMLCCSDKQWNLRVLPALNRRRLGLINGVLTLCGLRPPRTAHGCTQSSGIRRLYPRWWKLRLNVWLSLWSIKLHQTDTSRIHGKEFQRHFVSWVVSSLGWIIYPSPPLHLSLDLCWAGRPVLQPRTDAEPWETFYYREHQSWTEGICCLALMLLKVLCLMSSHLNDPLIQTSPLTDILGSSWRVSKHINLLL